MIEILENVLTEIFKKCGYNSTIKVIKSNRLDLCDYQCDSLFKLAKEYKESPLSIGSRIIEQTKNEDTSFYFKDIKLENPGFINMILSDTIINSVLNKMISNDKFNLKPVEQEIYFLDYGGPNIAKPLHVGHLRPAIIGESIKRIINFVGHKTISDVHLGDFGLQIGQVIYGIKEENKDITLNYLEELYPKMSNMCKENKDILEKCSKITKDLQEGNLEYLAMWKKICEISKQDIKRIYDYLDVSFDLWQGESDSYKFIEDVTKLFNDKSLIKLSEGAYVIDIKEGTDSKELPPLIYQKGNGAYLYGTTDLATIYERVTKYKADHILYVVDARQGMHFKQVFRAFKKLNYNVTLNHLELGTVNGLDGKPFKTRSGDTVKLENLFSQVKEAFKLTKESNKEMNDKDLNIIVNAIIKFADLQNSRKQDYVFDISKFSQVVGKTGPYILYTYLRINKILKEQVLTIDYLNDKIYNSFDRDLRLKLLDLPNSINQAFKDHLPNYIAEFVYDICVLSNIFYQNNHVKTVLDATKQQWLLLLTLNNNILKQLLNLLVIEIPSEM